MTKLRVQLPGDISHELHRITEVAAELSQRLPTKAEELNDAVSCLRQLVADLLDKPSATESIETGFARSLNETTLDGSQS